MTADETPVKGTRRIDRVLAEDYLDGLSALSLAEVRALRTEAEQEEVDLSYLRRLIQGRMDVIKAETRGRSGEAGAASSADLIARLSSILAEEPRAPARGLGRHSALEPSRADSHRRYVEAMVADVDLSDVSARSADDLDHSLHLLADEERKISAKRRDVQAVMDACSAEITRRYRDGEADVSALLAPESTGGPSGG